jgi:hypothetical protein
MNLSFFNIPIEDINSFIYTLIVNFLYKYYFNTVVDYIIKTNYTKSFFFFAIRNIKVK